MFHAVFSPSVLWCNQQTVIHFVLRIKPRNRHDNFEAQITKPDPPVLKPNQKTVAIGFEVKSGNRRHQF
jgi:hypothetical protein